MQQIPDRFGDGDIPDRGNAVLGTAGQVLSVGAKGQISYGCFLRELMNPVTRGSGPKIDIPITRSCRDKICRRRKRCAGDFFFTSQLDSRGFASPRIPKPHFPIRSSSQKLLAVVVEANAGKACTVNHRFSDRAPGGEVPKLCDAIFGSGGKKISLTAANYFKDGAGVHQRLTDWLS